ncbi:MAG: ABC transporter permease [Candidatus Korobacteraceae bacterium]
MALPLSYNVRNLSQRWKVTLLAIFGIGLVVAVFVTLLSMVAGFRIALRSTGSPLNGIVTQRGSMSELTSWINIGDANVIMVDPRVARDSNGKPLASCEVVVLTNRPRRADNQPANITFRGVSPSAFQVRNGVKIVAGRSFTPGLYEVIVGKKIADRVTGLDIGDTISIQKKDWKVVGLFTADGSSFESEIWGDYDAMAPAIGRNGGCESLTLRLTDPKLLPAFDRDIRANPRVQLQIDSEPKYYENLAGGTADALLGLAGFVAVVMGIGAVFGAMNTMYAIVSQRTRENRHAARAGLFALQHSVLVCAGVGAAGPGRRRPGMSGRLHHEWLHRRHRPNGQFQRVGLRLQDHAPGADLRHGVRGADGVCGRIAARLPRFQNADHKSAARSVESPPFALRFSPVAFRLSLFALIFACHPERRAQRGVEGPLSPQGPLPLTFRSCHPERSRGICGF